MTLYDEVCKVEKGINVERDDANRMPCRMGDGVSFDDEYDVDALRRPKHL